MAVQLRGDGAATGVNLVIRTYNNNVTKDGRETQYLDAQVDARDPRGVDKTTLHLVSQKRENPETGKVTYQNSAPYTKKQFEAIKEAAGKNVEPIMKDGEQIGAVYGIKANVAPASREEGWGINTKTLQASDYNIDGKTMDRQFDAVNAAVAARNAKQAAEKTAPQNEQQGEQPAQVAEENLEPQL